MPVSPPADKRFRRPHVRPARRRSRRGWRPKLAMLALALTLTVSLGYAAVALVVSADALRIRRILVDGNARISTGEVHALLEGAMGSSVLTADLSAWREKLRASPWVADVVVRRVFPASVSVTLSERLAMGIGRVNGALYLIDRTGTIIDEYGSSHADLDLPMIDGLAARREGKLMVDQDRSRLTGRLLSALQSRPDLAQRISQIDVTDIRDVVVVLEGDPALVHIGTERFVERLQSYVEISAVLRERVPDIDYVNLRYDERVIVGSRADVTMRTRPRTKG